MITSYFGSDICSFCNAKCEAKGASPAVVCKECQRDPVVATHLAITRLSEVQKAAHAVAKDCGRCSLCFEDASTFAPTAVVDNKAKGVGTRSSFWGAERSSTKTTLCVPMSHCVCIDCPRTFERHRLRELELEAKAVCGALDLF